jgi:hypothetical protein
VLLTVPPLPRHNPDIELNISQDKSRSIVRYEWLKIAPSHQRLSLPLTDPLHQRPSPSLSLYVRSLSSSLFGCHHRSDLPASYASPPITVSHRMSARYHHHRSALPRFLHISAHHCHPTVCPLTVIIIIIRLSLALHISAHHSLIIVSLASDCISTHPLSLLLYDRSLSHMLLLTFQSLHQACCFSSLLLRPFPFISMHSIDFQHCHVIIPPTSCSTTTSRFLL